MGNSKKLFKPEFSEKFFLVAWEEAGKILPALNLA
jgi:hypothetical protein